MLKYPQWLVLVGFIQAFNIMWFLVQFWKNYTPLLGGLVLWLYPLHRACAWRERAAAQNPHDINRTHDSKFGTEVSNSENPPTAQQFSHALHVQCIISLPCFWAGGSATTEGSSSLFLSVFKGLARGWWWLQRSDCDWLNGTFAMTDPNCNNCRDDTLVGLN